MPTYHLRPASRNDEDSFWVHAIDDFDARSQLALTLRLDAHDEASFECEVDPRFSMPLNVILHSTAEWTEVALPPQLREQRESPSNDESPRT